MTNEFLDFHLQDQELEDAAILGEWLPSAVFDSHLHAAPNLNIEMINCATNRPGETFNFFDWNLHLKILKTIFPNQKFSAAVFGFPHMPDYSAENEYIHSLAEHDNSIIPIYRIDTPSVKKDLSEKLTNDFFGLKMYPTNEQKRKPTKVIDIFPREVLRITNNLSRCLIIHLPNNLSDNLEELLALAYEFPCAKFVLAHMGVFYCYDPKFEDALSSVKHFNNIFFDTAMVADVKVISKAMEIIGPDRILFGSDAPFSYFRGGFIIGQDGKLRFYSQTKFSWVKEDDRKIYANEISTLKLSHINILMAIKNAMEVLAPTSRNQAKNQILRQNSNLLFCTT
jgi:predicted TIM-barrel fold metal-dependent hydrolase